MLKKDLNTEFENAYLKVSNTHLKLPPDIMLQFYAYYKQATSGTNYQEKSSNSLNLRNAFKLNAWAQLSHISEDEAKIAYIKLASKHIP